MLAPGRADPDRLGGVAAVVWEVLDHPMDLASIDDAVGPMLGTPGSAVDAITRLRAERLVLVET